MGKVWPHIVAAPVDLSVTYAAWKVRDGQQAYPIAITAGSLDEALNAALPGCSHKTTLFIRQDDAGRGESTLYAWAIKRKSQPRYVRGEDGTSKPVHDLYADPLFTFAVDAFEPTRPFDAFRDDPVGIDRTLVEGRALKGMGQ